MKIANKQVDSFVRTPDPTARVILIYGPDKGLVKERAALIGKKIVADLNDPFNAVTLTSDILDSDPARLVDEANAFSMLGGNRLIRIENADDSLTALLKDYLSAPSTYNLIVIEAGILATKSPLRQLCEKSNLAAALPCYVDDGRDLSALIRDQLRQSGYEIQAEALSWLTINGAGDRARIRSEVEKLVTYMTVFTDTVGKRIIVLADVLASCGESGVQTLEDLVQAIASAHTEDALRYYTQLLSEGSSSVAMLRALQTHFRKLHLAQSRVVLGMNIDEAVKKVSPPVFFKQEDAFRSQLRRWTMPSLEKLLERLTSLEAQVKQTGVPVEALCGQAFLSMSRARA